MPLNYFRGMKFIVLDTEALDDLKQDLKEYIKHCILETLSDKKTTESSDWLGWEDAKKLLPYKSKSTWQNLRDQGLIEFSQAPNSRNILYSRKSILNYINLHKVKF